MTTLDDIIGTTRPPIQLADFNSVTDQVFDNTLFLFAGDSKEEQAVAAGGQYDRLAFYASAGGLLSGAAGFVNCGSSGYKLANFVSDSFNTSPFSSAPNKLLPASGDPNWDFAGHKPSGALPLANVIYAANGWLNQNPGINKVVITVGHGTNDLILGSLGTGTVSSMVAGLVPLLVSAVQQIRAQVPQASIVLRAPSPMTSRPFNPAAGYPSTTVYPSYGSNAASDATLVDNWNQALRKAYRAVSNSFSRVIYQDKWLDVGVSNTTLPSADAGTVTSWNPVATTIYNPNLANMVHDGSTGFAYGVDGFVEVLYRSRTKTPYGGRRRSVALAKQIVGNAWDTNARYFEDNPQYKKVVDCELSAAGSNYIDFAINYATFGLALQGAKNIYVQIGQLTAFQLTNIPTPSDQGGIGVTTRLTPVTIPTAAQGAAGRVSIYLDANVTSGDATVDSQLSNVSTYRYTYKGTMTTCGVGFLRFVFDSTNGRPSTAFIASCKNWKLQIGGASPILLDLSNLTPTLFGVAANHIVQFQAGSTDYTAYTNQPAVLLIDDSTRSPVVQELQLPVVVAGNINGSTSGATAAAISSGGTGHAVNDVITLANSVQVKVLTVSGGVIQTVSVQNSGLAYPDSLPTNPQAQVSTSGSGTGATFNLTWLLNGAVISAPALTNISLIGSVTIDTVTAVAGPINFNVYRWSTAGGGATRTLVSQSGGAAGAIQLGNLGQLKTLNVGAASGSGIDIVLTTPIHQGEVFEFSAVSVPAALPASAVIRFGIYPS